MERGTGPYQPPPGGPTPGTGQPPDPDAVPATRRDIRDLRRWLIVTAVWAVAGSAIAIIALLSDDTGDSSRSGDDSAAISRVHRDLNERIDELDSKVDDLPASDDVSKLESQLRDVEEQSSQAASEARDAREKVSDLENRVEEVEQGQQGTGGTGAPDQP